MIELPSRLRLLPHGSSFLGGYRNVQGLGCRDVGFRTSHVGFKMLFIVEAEFELRFRVLDGGLRGLGPSGQDVGFWVWGLGLTALDSGLIGRFPKK